MLLVAALGAAAICVFFSAPNLPALLIVGPAACAAPLIALFLNPATRPLGNAALAATALAFALSDDLQPPAAAACSPWPMSASFFDHTERARSLADAKRLTKSKSDLIATLSHEVRTGLTGVAHVLASAAGGGRAQPSRDQLTARWTPPKDLIAGAGRHPRRRDRTRPPRAQHGARPSRSGQAGARKTSPCCTAPQASAKGLELTAARGRSAFPRKSRCRIRGRRTPCACPANPHQPDRQRCEIHPARPGRDPRRAHRKLPIGCASITDGLPAATRPQPEAGAPAFLLPRIKRKRSNT